MREHPSTARTKRPTKVRLNYGKMRQDHDRISAGSSRIWRAPKGTTKIRLMMLPDEGLWYVTNREIYVPSVEGTKKFFISPRSTDPEAYCPAEEAYKLLLQAGRKDEAKEIRPSNQFFSNAMVNEGKEWKYKIFKYPQSVYNDLMLAEADELDEDALDEEGFLEGGGIIGDPKEGRVLSVHVEEKGGYSRYTTRVTNKPLPIEPEWATKCQTLDEFLAPDNPDEIEEAILDWLGIEDLEEIAASAAPSKGKRKQEEEEEFLEEEEEDDAPAPWEDDELEEGTEEEEELPTRKLKTKPTSSSATGKRRLIRRP